MNPDLLLPIITSIMWLILCGTALASYQLKWSQMAKMALVWVAIFGGVFLATQWIMVARGTASVPL
jgi:hypothetical protein